MLTTPPERRQNRPDYRLELDGRDLTDTVRPRLISLRLTEKRGGEADDLDLVLDDSDGKLALPRKGVLIRLALGWATGADVTVGLVDKGRFTVDEVAWDSAPATITVKARSADLTAGYRVRRERSHRATTLGTIARQVAAANGLVARVSPELADIPIDIVAQDGRSDMALIRQLGRRYDAVATVKDRNLILAPIGATITSSGTPIPGATITRSMGDRASWRTVEREAYAKVEARWHDQAGADRRTVSADIAGAPAGADDGRTRRLRRTYHTEADASAAAQAEARRIARRGAELSLDLALARPDLYPGRRLVVTGFKPDIDGDWLLAGVDHGLDGHSGGFTSSLRLETA